MLLNLPWYYFQDRTDVCSQVVTRGFSDYTVVRNDRFWPQPITLKTVPMVAGDTFDFYRNS